MEQTKNGGRDEVSRSYELNGIKFLDKEWEEKLNPGKKKRRRRQRRVNWKETPRRTLAIPETNYVTVLERLKIDEGVAMVESGGEEIEMKSLMRMLVF